MQELDLSGDARTSRMPNGGCGCSLLGARRRGGQALTRGDPENGRVCDMIDRFQGQPYLTTESDFDHGTSAGYWRIIHVLEQHAAPCTLNACAEALASSAWLGRERPGARPRAPAIPDGRRSV